MLKIGEKYKIYFNGQFRDIGILSAVTYTASQEFWLSISIDNCADSIYSLSDPGIHIEPVRRNIFRVDDIVSKRTNRWNVEPGNDLFNYKDIDFMTVHHISFCKNSIGIFFTCESDDVYHPYHDSLYISCKRKTPKQYKQYI